MRQKWHDLALALLVGFTFFLRMQEMLQLRSDDFRIDLSDGLMVLRIATSKTSRGAQQSLALTDHKLAWLISFLLGKLPLGEPLWHYSFSYFRNVFYSFCDFFEVSHLNFVPYSICRGGATAYYLRVSDLESVIIQGRWRDVATARIYLDDARATLVKMHLSKTTRQLLFRFRKPLTQFVSRLASGKL